MATNFENMMYLFGAGSKGSKFNSNYEIDWRAVLKIAQKHDVWQTVYLLIDDNNIKKEYEDLFLNSITRNMQRVEFSLETIKKMEESGIPCCMLKGMSVARFYNEPLCRISGDVDVLIPPENEKEAMVFLSELGYNVTPRGKNSHHFLANHSIGGLMEVHVKMYSDPTKDILLNNMVDYKEDYITFDIYGHMVKTLGITDGAIYITAHYIKHFLSKGVGIRQLMDVLLYIDNYRKEINWDRYNKVFKDLRYDKLIKNMMAVGNKYFSFEFPVIDDSCIDIILQDGETGGVFGPQNGELDKFYEAFLHRRTFMESKNFEKYMYTKTRGNLIQRIFPHKSIMQKQGFICNNKVDLLKCYIIRLCKILKAMLISKSKRNQAMKYSYNFDNESEIVKKRLAMMQRLNILE